MRTELRSNRWGVSGRSGRREDLRFLTGRGRYVADLALEHAAHLAVVRSPHACARTVRVAADPARAQPGVLGVFTLADLPELDRETGAVSVLAYHAVHDAGHEINPLVVEGQTQGGAVQGIGASCDSPSPLNPLGLKGTGEGSAVPGPAAIANAVADALGAGGPEITEVPIRARMLAHRS